MTEFGIPEETAAVILDLGEQYVAWAQPLLQQGDAGALADAIDALSVDDLRCHLLAATLLLTTELAP